MQVPAESKLSYPLLPDNFHTSSNPLEPPMVHRRSLIAAGLALSAASQVRVRGAQEQKKQVVLGVMGLSRGQSLAMDVAKFEGVEV